MALSFLYLMARRLVAMLLGNGLRPAPRRVSVAGVVIVCGRLVRRSWTCYRWEGRPHRRPVTAYWRRLLHKEAPPGPGALPNLRAFDSWGD